MFMVIRVPATPTILGTTGRLLPPRLQLENQVRSVTKLVTQHGGRELVQGSESWWKRSAIY
jgi:hypothetical protein